MENIYTFYGKKDYLSNFYHSPYVVDNNTFSCSEQGFMYDKAMYFGDTISAQKILELPYDNPADYKKLGRQVTPFDNTKWDSVREEIMKKHVKAKIEQSDVIKTFVMNDLKDKLIVESSPRDRFWGVGVGKEKALDTSKWRGKNKLGYIIMEIRNELV